MVIYAMARRGFNPIGERDFALIVVVFRHSGFWPEKSCGGHEPALFPSDPLPAAVP